VSTPSDVTAGVQAHWQYDAAAIVAGTIRGSSIIQDQRRSRLNARLVEALRTGVLQNASLNLLEVDDVCDHGPQLAAALTASRAAQSITVLTSTSVGSS
jgi:hypothetical protein